MKTLHCCNLPPQAVDALIQLAYLKFFAGLLLAVTLMGVAAYYIFKERN